MAGEADRPPHRIVADHAAAFAGASDDQVLAALAALAPLPDESGPEWDGPEPWDRTYLYLALADVAAARRLRAAISLLLDRACLGDPGETMRGLRHAFETIVTPDWPALAEICLERAASARPGTRLWALNQLAVLEDERARPLFEAARESPQPDIRDAAETGLHRLNRRIEQGPLT